MKEDKRLIKKCLKNDVKAKCQLYEQHKQMMFGVCMRYAKNRMEAEDILHDAFIKVLNNLDKYRGEGPLGGWVRRITVNTCLNFLRDKKPEVDDLDNVCDGDFDACEDKVHGSISEKELLRYIHELPDGYRTVFNLYVIEGYKHHEIGEMLGISENTSKTQLSKAKKALKARLVKEKFDYAV